MRSRSGCGNPTVFFRHERLPDPRSWALGPQFHGPPRPPSRKVQPGEEERLGYGRQGEAPTCAPPQPFLLPGKPNESWSPPAGTARRPSWAASCQPAPGMAWPLRPSAGPAGDWARERPRGRGLGPGAAARRGWPGPPRSSGGHRVARRGAAGPAGEGVRRAREWPPAAAPGAPPLTCSRPPAGSGAGRAATGCSLCRPFIPAPSAAARPTRAANPRPRVAAAAGPGAGDGLAAAGTEEATCAAGIAGPGRRSAGRAGGQTDGLAETGGQAGGAGAREAGPGEERQPGRRRLREERAARSEAAPCRGPRGRAGSDSRARGAALRLPGPHACADPGRALRLRLPCGPQGRGLPGPGPRLTPAPEKRGLLHPLIWN